MRKKNKHNNQKKQVQPKEDEIVKMSDQEPEVMRTEEISQVDTNAVKDLSHNDNSSIISIEDNNAYIKKRAELNILENQLKDREKIVSEKEKNLNLREDDILKREPILENKQLTINAKEIKLKEKENILSKQAQVIIIKENTLNSKEKELAKKEKTLLETETEIYKREVNAEAGFTEQNKKALQILLDQKEQLKKDIQNEENKLNKYKNDELDKINQLISNQRKEMFKNLTNEFQVKEKQLEEVLNSKLNETDTIIRKKTSECKLNEENSDRLLEEYKAKFDALNDKEIELKTKELELKAFDKILKQDKKNIDYEISVRVNGIEETYKSKDTNRGKTIQEQSDTINKLEEKIRNYEYLKSRFENEPGKIKQELNEKEEKIQNLQYELSKRPSQEILAEFKDLQMRNLELTQKNIELIKENGELKVDQTNWIVSVSELQTQRDLKEVAEHHLYAINARVEKYNEEVKRLTSLLEQPKEIEARIGVMKEPYFVTKSNKSESDINEIDWLQSIFDKCIESGIKFNKRLLYAFHTALKTSEWSPLTVLAGVSGTGKSELPRLYSRFGGLYYLPLPVQPDWDSPQSLFGFFNSIDNRFNATPLLKALVQAQSNDEGLNLSNNLLLVLLDEMNLAHIELYFSELLSKLETRRGDKEGVNLEVDLGAGLRHNVKLTKNVLWAGTMNEDETTKSLSDKVLDRGNLISFPRPKEFERRLKLDLADESKMLQKTTWDFWLSSKINFADEIKDYKDALQDINGYLEEVGRALGHRVWQSVENYMANHPLVIQAKSNSKDDDYKNYLKLAFADALVQKVMPKLRGIETDGVSKDKCLIKIGSKIHDIVSGSLDEDFRLAMTSTQGVFVWRSAKYLENEDV